MNLQELLYRIRHKLTKLRLQPIRVYCLHHVCEKYDEDTMYRGDWMQIDEFKQKVQKIRQNGVKFISLSDAYAKLTNDKFRNRKYAVLTFDDGYASLKEILPWLENQKIPATLFINGKYLDGKSYRKNPNEKYLTKEELFSITSPLIEVGSHGWKHADASKISVDEFEQSIAQNVELLHTHPRFIPFHAYTWGRHTSNTDDYLLSQGIKPVCIDGAMNYNDLFAIHRELL